MERIEVHVDERLASAGDVLPLAGHIDLEGYELGNHEFSLPAGLDYDLMLTNAGDGILASGIVRAQVEGECDRCLEPASFDLSAEVNEYFLFEEPEELADDEDEVDFSLVEDDRIDVSEAIMAALLMDTPYVVLCKEDCKGLCPRCGANLNEGDCGCAERDEERRMEESPFAALKNLM